MLDRSDIPDGLTGISRSLSSGLPLAGPMAGSGRTRWLNPPTKLPRVLHRNRMALISLGIPKLVRFGKIGHRSVTNRPLLVFLYLLKAPEFVAVPRLWPRWSATTAGTAEPGFCCGRESVQPETAPLREQPHEGVMGLPDLFGQFFDIAAGQFRTDASLAGIVQLDLDSLMVNHGIPLSHSVEPVLPRNPSRTIDRRLT
jgi:hypothetical protein